MLIPGGRYYEKSGQGARFFRTRSMFRPNDRFENKS